MVYAYRGNKYLEEIGEIVVPLPAEFIEYKGVWQRKVPVKEVANIFSYLGIIVVTNGIGFAAQSQYSWERTLFGGKIVDAFDSTFGYLRGQVFFYDRSVIERELEIVQDAFSKEYPAHAEKVMKFLCTGRRMYVQCSSFKYERENRAYPLDVLEEYQLALNILQIKLTSSGISILSKSYHTNIDEQGIYCRTCNKYLGRIERILFRNVLYMDRGILNMFQNTGFR